MTKNRKYLPNRKIDDPVLCDQCNKDVGLFCTYVVKLKSFLCNDCYSDVIKWIIKTFEIIITSE